MISISWISIDEMFVLAKEAKVICRKHDRDGDYGSESLEDEEEPAKKTRWA